MADGVAEPPAGAPGDRTPTSPPTPPAPSQSTPPADHAAGAKGHPIAREVVLPGKLAYDRVLFFSDGVFAIAITLLVVDIRVPSPASGKIDATTALHAALPEIRSFAISFAVIGLFWLGHHNMFGYITVLNRTLMLLNLLFLATIAFLPYPTALLSGAVNGQVTATVFYASCVAAAGLAEAAIWFYAISARSLMRGRVDPRVRRYYSIRLLTLPLVFGVSIPVALADPQTAAYLWLVLIPLAIIARRATSRAEEAVEQ